MFCRRQVKLSPPLILVWLVLKISYYIMLISMHIFHIVLNTKFISYGVDKENLMRLKSFNRKLVIISFILWTWWVILGRFCKENWDASHSEVPTVKLCSGHFKVMFSLKESICKVCPYSWPQLPTFFSDLVLSCHSKIM